MEVMDELTISGKRYISSRRAAKEYHYHSDYIGQLIRSGKVAGQKVGHNWYVSASSLAAYLRKKEESEKEEAEGETKVKIKKEAQIEHASSTEEAIEEEGEVMQEGMAPFDETQEEVESIPVEYDQEIESPEPEFQNQQQHEHEPGYKMLTYLPEEHARPLHEEPVHEESIVESELETEAAPAQAEGEIFPEGQEEPTPIKMSVVEPTVLAEITSPTQVVTDSIARQPRSRKGRVLLTAVLLILALVILGASFAASMVPSQVTVSQ